MIMGWALPPLSNSWITIIIWLYIALNRTPNIDCYWVGAVPKLWDSIGLSPVFTSPYQGCGIRPPWYHSIKMNVQ